MFDNLPLAAQLSTIVTLTINLVLPVNDSAKPYGITVTLPPNDPMAAPHLLGPDWSQSRWFATADERDKALREMSDHPRYYRKGDVPSVVFSTVDP